MVGAKMRRRRENFELFGGILRGFWSFWGAIFGLSGTGPPAAPRVFADLGQEGGTTEVISPDVSLLLHMPNS